jgi:hypothetical protein
VRPVYREDDQLANDTTTERFRLGDFYRYSFRERGFNADRDRQFKQFRVTAIHDDVVETNDGTNTFDRLGNIQMRKDKQWRDAQFFPAEYAVGKRWPLVVSLQTDRRDDLVKLQARIAARERISVPAGQFDVFRIEIAGRGQQDHSYSWTYWMNPKYGMPIKWIETRYNPRGRIGKESVHELVQLQAPR